MMISDKKVVSGRGIKLDDVATLFDQGIDADVVAKLVENRADLGDIAVNVRVLLDTDIRVDLVNIWLSNETNLNNAIAIMKQGVDLNLIGTSSTVGGFTGIMGASPNEIIARIPRYAKIRRWKTSPHIKDGMKFGWTDASGQDWLVEMRGPDSNPRTPANANATNGWVVRIQRNRYYMDNAGSFYKENWLKPTSSKYDPVNANASHIPIQAP